MKRIPVFLVLALLLVALAQSTPAADLKAGWYVNISPIDVFTYGWPDGQPHSAYTADFWQTPVGQYGPFAVTGPPNDNDSRDISVPAAAYGVGPDQSLVVPLFISLAPSAQIAYLRVLVNYGYDPTQMNVSLYHTGTDGTDRVVWSGMQSVESGVNGHLASNTTLDGGFYFKIVVVPEPSYLVCMCLGLVPLIWLVRSGRRQPCA